MTRFAVLAAALLAVVSAADAQQRPPPPAIVEAVQMPAWVDRNGVRVPLAPGMRLKSDDSLTTGPSARLLLTLAEGSSVKLGENARLNLADLQTRRDNVFVAVLNVLQGAFRFTTAALARAREREVSISVATVTAGIRGTDLWGKAAADRDIVCLIEGVIEVQRAGDPAATMDQPKSFYIAPKGRPPLPIAPVSDEQLAKWADETEVANGSGAARRGGPWAVILATSESQNEALDVYEAVRRAGYAAQLQPAREGGKRVYHVRIAYLPSEAEAQALADRLAGHYGVGSPRVVR